MIANPYLFFTGDVPLAARVYRNTDDLLVRQPAVLVTGSWLQSASPEFICASCVPAKGADMRLIVAGCRHGTPEVPSVGTS